MSLRETAREIAGETAGEAARAVNAIPGRPAVTVALVGSLPLASPWNGADKVIARTIACADTGNRYLVATGPADDWPTHVVPFREARPAQMPGPASLVRGAAYLLRATPRADVLHVVASRRQAGPTSRLLRGAARLAGLPVIHTLPSGNLEALPMGRPLGDVTVVFSDHSARQLRAAGVSDVVSMFPPLALDHLVRRGPDRERELRARLDLGPLPVLYAGHLDEGGGVAEAIAALARLPEDLAHVRLVLAVRWRPGQDVTAAVAALERDAAVAGVADRLRWLRSVPDMPSLIGACALTTLVPRSLEGKMDLPLVLLESLALGRPIVVADRPPITEALLGGGLAVPFGDADALASSWASLLRDAGRRDALAAAGRTRLLQAADPSRAAARYGELYERVLGAAGREVVA